MNASDLHRNSLVIDSHNDTVVSLIRRGNVGIAGETGADRHGRAGAVAYLRQYLSPRDPAALQFSLPRLREGGGDGRSGRGGRRVKAARAGGGVRGAGHRRRGRLSAAVA